MNINFFKWCLKDFVLRKTKKKRIMARVACMGKDVINLLNPDYLLVNIQKGRIDSDEVNSIFNFKSITKHVERNDIKKLIYEQFIKYSFKKNPPEAIFIDSYSELTDQQFRNKLKKYSFYVNYSDINHSSKFKEEFENLGLISLNEVERYYRQWIEKITNIYGREVPIIYLHFPTCLDKRKKFRDRGEKLKTITNNITKTFENFHVFDIPDDLVERAEEDPDYPYHYSDKVYLFLANKIKKSKILV